MTNDAMTKADAARERLVGLIGPGWPPYWEVLQQYGDARAVEAEIGVLWAFRNRLGDPDDERAVARLLGKMLADAEQRERGMG